ncbi:MAG: ATP-dependent DNA ligase [Actinobacteria bacterium]|nr:ATP-dependent DNA ligase [Actinomycetota bacterium]
MLLSDLVATSDRVANTSSRSTKRDEIAELLRGLDAREMSVAVGFLTGEARQGRIGVGWATVGHIDTAPASTPSLMILDVDATLDRLARISGSGSNAARAAELDLVFGRATAAEQSFLRRLLIGELRQGALEGVMLDAIAKAAGVPATAVRRAFMLSGDLGTTATAALTKGRVGLDATGLTVLRGIQPMLASTANSIDDALTATPGKPMSVEWKLDGARIQVHRDGDDVRIYTRNLNEVSARLPEIVAVARSLPVTSFVLDGEVLGYLGDGSLADTVDGAIQSAAPQRFQDTISTFSREHDDGAPATALLRPFFFDVLHADGRDLIDDPLADRRVTLSEVAPNHRIPGIITADELEAKAFLDDAIATGHEGVMVKDLASPYAAGRRGKSWRKVKPVRLLDLVVIAVEWGSGRRQGRLSNLHLGARSPNDNSFVMVGKTFKGLTDEILEWQTRELLAREIGREAGLSEDAAHSPGGDRWRQVVHVRPELVVEIALDGVQASRRYPGGVTLRFARVRRYRTDKPASEADTIDTVRELLPSR